MKTEKCSIILIFSIYCLFFIISVSACVHNKQVMRRIYKNKYNKIYFNNGGYILLDNVVIENIIKYKGENKNEF